MTKIEETFFELIRVSIDNSTCLTRSPSADEWGELYSMAKKQSLVGICFAGVQKLSGIEDSMDSTGSPQVSHKPYTINLPEVLYLQWLGMAAKIQQRNEVVNRQCVELQAKLSADGYRSCILKGQGVAQLYDESLKMLRQSGDIDVWCVKDGVDENFETQRAHIVDYVMRQLPTTDFDEKHMHYDMFGDTVVEIHYVPSVSASPIVSKHLNEYYRIQLNKQLKYNKKDVLNFPSLEFQFLHQLLHSYGHFVYEGIGLRQLMDLYYSLMKYKDSSEFNLNRILKLLNSFNLTKFLSAALWVLQYGFGLDESYFIMNPDQRLGAELLKDISLGGNLGASNMEIRMSRQNFLSLANTRLKRQFRLFRYDPWFFLSIPSFLMKRIKTYQWIRGIKRMYDL